MSTVAEIEAAIEQLPLREQQQLREWFLQHPLPSDKEDNDDLLVPAAYRQKVLDAIDHS